MSRARTVMLQGTASDVGKSIVTTAICRILHQDGWSVAPYKSQNMALNSYVTLDGKEIGRAQGIQAEACQLAATTDMNPILIKPTKEMAAQVVVHGRPHAEMSARRYREEYLPLAESIVLDAFHRLAAAYDVVVLEGAGSPAEINLKQRDIVNMRLAGWTDSPVILVADIDRGGVFASIVGTLELLEPHERARIKAFIINKFRGDLSLLQPGLDWLYARTGIPVLGVLPYLRDLNIEAEDSVALEHKPQERPDAELDIAVIYLPRISNFTDVDPLAAEPDVRIRYIQKPQQLGTPDIIIIPGSKNTLEDLVFMRSTGLAAAMEPLVRNGCELVGICGGYQMLGRELCDPDHVESSLGSQAGLGYLPAKTTFYVEKHTRRVSGTVQCGHKSWQHFHGDEVCGYEIHMGQTEPLAPVERLFVLAGQEEGMVNSKGNVWGTYLHGVFHNDAFRRHWLNELRKRKNLAPVASTILYRSRQEEAFDRLADHVRAHLDMDKLYNIIGLAAKG